MHLLPIPWEHQKPPDALRPPDTLRGEGKGALGTNGLTSSILTPPA